MSELYRDAYFYLLNQTVPDYRKHVQMASTTSGNLDEDVQRQIQYVAEIHRAHPELAELYHLGFTATHNTLLPD